MIVRKKLLLFCELICLLSMILSNMVFASTDEDTIHYSVEYDEENYLQYYNEDSGYYVALDDQADLFYAEEQYALMDEMLYNSQFGNMVLLTVEDNRDGKDSIGEQYYHRTFGTESGTVFIVDMDYRYLSIFSDGDNYKTITDYKAKIITDNIYRYASDGDYVTCAMTAIDQIYATLNGAYIAQPMRYISSACFAVILSLIICFIYVIISSNIMKPNMRSLLENMYTQFRLEDSREQLSHTTKEYSPQSSSSGGGGGGGGGLSGGGGGHGF